VGARLFYVLFHLEEFRHNWTASFNPFASDQFGIAGLNMYGGVLVAVTGALVHFRIKKISALDMFDYISPTLGLGIAITRIGCFLNGCCFGTPTDLPWGVTFPKGSIPYWVFQDTPLHPAQLYSSLYGLILFILLHFLLKKRKFIGQPVAVLFMAEAVFRFAIEYVRYYEEAMHFSVAGLHPTYNQVISVGLFAAGLVIYLVQSRRADARCV
jgi:phosphatidylglycerol:prolipoprotein diacylglycerol transferase